MGWTAGGFHDKQTEVGREVKWWTGQAGQLTQILPGCQQMSNVPNGVETLPKNSIA